MPSSCYSGCVFHGLLPAERSAGSRTISCRHFGRYGEPLGASILAFYFLRAPGRFRSSPDIDRVRPDPPGDIADSKWLLAPLGSSRLPVCVFLHNFLLSAAPSRTPPVFTALCPLFVSRVLDSRRLPCSSSYCAGCANLSRRFGPNRVCQRSAAHF